MEKLFETASREKYRFPYRGQITTEDLWDLTTEQLDEVYKALNKAAKAQGEDSLLDKGSVSEKTKNQIEIVKHIFSIKLEEAAARKTAAENRAKRQRIMDVLAEKQDASLRDMSEEDLKKLLDSMG